MHPEIEQNKREIAELFNEKPKDGIKEISLICKEKGIDADAEIAEFLYTQKENLDLKEVGDYLGSEGNEKVLEQFRKKIDLKGQSFTEGLRGFLKTFYLPGEAQKIDRLMQAFSKSYCEGNPGITEDAAYVLAYSTIMLSTDQHNPSVKNKMTLQQFQSNNQGINNGKDFDPKFLKEIYNDMQQEKLEVVFSKVSPGYELNSADLKNDKTFKDLDLILKSSRSESQAVNKVFPDMGDHVSAKLTKPKSFLNKLTGYEGTITITDAKTHAQATVQVYKPNVFSKYLFGDKPKTIIQPNSGGKASLDLATKLAASFSSSVSTVKATYGYEKSDMQASYEGIRASKEITAISKSLKSHVVADSSSAKVQVPAAKRSASSNVER